MILFFRIALVLILLILGPLAWIGHNGWMVTRSIPQGTMVADGPFAVSAPLPIPRHFTDVSDDKNNIKASKLRLFEDARELGPPHTPGTTIKANGHGGFSHWGHRIYFSSSDDTSPSSNGRVYRVEFRVYPVIEDGRIAIPGLIGIFAGVYVACRFLILMRQSKAETLRSRAMSGASAILLLVASAADWLAVFGWTTHWTPASTSFQHYDRLAYSAVLPSSKTFETFGDSIAGLTSDLRLFENGKELGPAHMPGDEIASQGKGKFTHWGSTLVFSSSDGSDPQSSGYAYQASYTEYLKPRVLWYGITASGLLLTLLAWLRFNSRSAPQARMLDRRISATTRAFLAPRAVFKLAGLTLAYAVCLFLIVSSLTVQQGSLGELKINFEYKIF
ncbi:MAG: hypothetical protein QOD09_956 [Bradyrhizobium sp.]|jgi:hypothetical protein|nr:hypothetical protein [Bradyrhizobium sp.]